MFWRIAWHEVRFRFRALSTHVYFLLFFALSFLFINAAGGAFGDNFTLGGVSPNVAANSPYVLMLLTVLMSLFGVIITAAFMGQTIYRDYDSGIHPLTFTTPVRRIDFLGGRFVGALAVNLYIFMSFALGLMAGEVTPWLDAGEFGPFRLAAYLQPYLLFVVPNLLFTGALFFALVATTRKMLPNYIGGLLLLVGHSVATTLIDGNPIENSTIAALLDPFGLVTAEQATRYWTTADQNVQLLPLAGTLLANRLLWIGISVAIVAGLIARFRFAHAPRGGSGSANPPEDGVADALMAARSSALISRLNLPSVQPMHHGRARLQQFVTLTRRAFSEIVRDVYFYAIVAGGLVFLIIGANQVGTQYGTTVQPVTRIVANELSVSFGLFMIVLIVFYAGQLVWRERDLKVQPITDAMPVPGSLALASKLVALVGMVVVLQAVVMAVGLGTQVVKGYMQFEFGLYLSELFGMELVRHALFCALALAAHTIVNHKYVGHLLIILYYVGLGFLPQLGLEHPLFAYSSGVGIPYSDMNGYGHFLTRFGWTALHWSAVALVLALVARLLWVRGTETTLRARWRLARQRLTRPMALSLGGAGVLMLCTGAIVFYNVNVLHTYRTNDEEKALRARYERTYGPEKAPQLRLRAVDVSVELFPHRRDAAIRGAYTLVNKTGRALDTVYVHVGSSDALHLDTLALSRPATAAVTDDILGFRTYALDAPLTPRDTMTLTFRQAIRTQGFGGGLNALAENGTFLRNIMLPQIGYQPGQELATPSDREDYGLPPQPPLPPLNDSIARRTNTMSRHAGWIDFTATVGTAADQIALAPGHRDSTWVENGRRYARFTAQPPMAHFYTVVSARYDTVAARWTPPDTTDHAPVDITVYHHPTHTFNLGRMVDGAQAALDYYTAHFGPYQNRHLRIAEFPQYHGAFAQSFLGTVPFSESMGFILRFDEEDDIDFPFYVTAHEVAHQWWGHQVLAANVEGATLLIETLSQYSALMVMKQRYGEHQMRRFLEYELDRYLSGRSQERRAERPLVRVANQSYVHYRKGANVMYALQDYIGEDRVNTALRRLVDRTKFTEPPYPTSHALMRELEAVTPDSLRYVLDDGFRTITLYENRTTDATVAPTDDGRYRVMLDVTTRKVQADSLGAETEVAMNDWIDVGVFPPDTSDAPPEPLYLQKHRLESGEQTITVTVDEEPARAGIDPYAKLIDRDMDDNVTSTSRAASDD